MSSLKNSIFIGLPLFVTGLTALAAPAAPAAGKTLVLLDELGDFTHISSDSGELNTTDSLPDQTALNRRSNTSQFIVYKQPLVTGFSVTIYFTPGSREFTNDDVNVFESKTGSDWSEVEIIKGEREDIPERGGWWQQNTVMNLHILSPGSNYLKFELPPAKDGSGVVMPDSEAWRVCLGRVELFTDTENTGAAKAVNLIPEKPGSTPDYWCTWAAQNYIWGQGKASIDNGGDTSGKYRLFFSFAVDSGTGTGRSEGIFSEKAGSGSLRRVLKIECKTTFKTCIGAKATGWPV